MRRQAGIRIGAVLGALAGALSLSGCPTVVNNGEEDQGGAEAPLDGPARGGDALPSGTIAFFKTPLCPNGWFPYGPAAGRLLVPTSGAEGVGETRGTPLTDREERKHKHGLKGELELRSTSFVGVAGSGNSGVAGAGKVAIVGTSDQASTGLPYLQLLVCQKSAPPRAAQRPVPRGTLAFFAGAACPEGWAQAEATQGRFLVALPEGGKHGAAFGGAPLAAKDTRAHKHDVTGKLDLGGHGLALASGCCGSGYAQAGSYTYAVAAEATDEPELPSLRLLHCQKR